MDPAMLRFLSIPTLLTLLLIASDFAERSTDMLRHKSLTFTDNTGNPGTVIYREWSNWQGPIATRCFGWKPTANLVVQLSDQGKAKFEDYEKVDEMLLETSNKIRDFINDPEREGTGCFKNPYHEDLICFGSHREETLTDSPHYVRQEFNNHEIVTNEDTECDDEGTGFGPGFCCPHDEPLPEDRGKFLTDWLDVRVDGPGPRGWDIRPIIAGFNDADFPGLTSTQRGLIAASKAAIAASHGIAIDQSPATNPSTQFIYDVPGVGYFAITQNVSTRTFSGNWFPPGMFSFSYSGTANIVLGNKTPPLVNTAIMTSSPGGGFPASVSINSAMEYSAVTAEESLYFQPTSEIGEYEVVNLPNSDFVVTGLMTRKVTPAPSRIVGYGDDPSCRIDVTYVNRRPYDHSCTSKDPNILQLYVNAPTGCFFPPNDVPACDIKVSSNPEES